jgi:hypothetical protein
MLAALKQAIRHAILVMLALPDLHDPHRYQLRSMWLPVADDPGLAYGFAAVKEPLIVPSPRDITAPRSSTHGWCGCAPRKASALCTGSFTGREACRPGCRRSGRTVAKETITNRIRSTAAILREFLEEEASVEPIEEPAALPVRHYHAAWEATTGEAGTREAFGKVWIDGIGLMKDGRRLRDGREKADDKRLYRDRP